MSDTRGNCGVESLAAENERLRAALARTQEELARQKERSASLRDKLFVAARTANIWAWESDIQANFLWDINRPTWLELDDVANKELGPRFFQLIDPDDHRTIVARHFDAIAVRAPDIVHRYRVHLPNGETRHLEGRASFVYDHSGRPVRVLGITLDVTRDTETAEQLRRQAEQLHEAQRRLETASLSSQEGHWIIDFAAQNCWASSSYYALLGYAPGAIDLSTREKYLELMHPDDKAREEAAFIDHIVKGMPLEVDVRLRPADGSWRWMRLRGMAEYDNAGQPVRISGSIQDIHEQRLAEDALRLVQLRFERAIRGTQDGLWEWDIHDDACWVSPRYEELLGYGEGEMPLDVGFWREITHPEDLPRVEAAQKAHFEDYKPFDVEVRVRHRDGGYRWMRARGEADRDPTGKPLRLAGSLQDITEAYAARDALIRATEAAQAANRAKSEFLANVSHEVRTPLNGIIGMAALLLDTPMSGAQLDYAKTIRSSADSLLCVINDILDFSKIEAGKLNIETLDMDLRENIDEVGTMLAFQAAAKNLELIVHVHPDVPRHLLGDAQRIRQCLINLVGNAIKFTQRGEIVVDVCSVGRRDGKVLTHFEVRDSGIGIAPQTLEKLFQPFVQADSSTTRHFGGTGLGLSIVKRLVEMMGGQLGVESKPGVGSTFWFMLPMYGNDPSGMFRTSTEGSTDRRVLVVDDSDASRAALRDLLVAAGYEVETAPGAREALASIRTLARSGRSIDAVLADLHMPGMDGVALSEQIAADPLLRSVKVVLLTSPGRAGDRTCTSADVAATLSKPVRERELLGCLGKLLGVETPERPGQNQSLIIRSQLRADIGTSRYSGRVLVVEDNPVNQKVAQRFLQRMGCEVHIAHNGLEGVEACQQQRFDLVLMDLQMPVMDGLAATARIRDLEGRLRRTPVVALTANAMAGQLEGCLAAGMDDVLTKPLSLERLRETLDRFGLQDTAQLTLENVPSTARAGIHRDVIDWPALNALTDGDARFMQDLASTFIASSRRILAEMNANLTGSDPSLLARDAHQLKGASSSVHASGLHALCVALESSAADMTAEERRTTLDAIIAEVERVGEALAPACRTAQSA